MSSHDSLACYSSFFSLQSSFLIFEAISWIKHQHSDSSCTENAFQNVYRNYYGSERRKNVLMRVNVNISVMFELGNAWMNMSAFLNMHLTTILYKFPVKFVDSFSISSDWNPLELETRVLMKLSQLLDLFLFLSIHYTLRLGNSKEPTRRNRG